ncbi:MAG TPA: CRISPR-associated endonuclease Cas1 [Thermoanaerobaculia bacterium]|nr:CRISPR-associated endonuclease Cas1 [Thermoanaerobaculia bacterium]
MLKRQTWDDLFDFEGRNRRPPKDPINALVSFVNSLLTRDWVTTLEAVGLDPYMGFYQRPKYGKPALALDMMEFRSVIADSVVIGMWNNGEIGESDTFTVEGGVLLTPQARKRVIEAYEPAPDLRDRGATARPDAAG